MSKLLFVFALTLITGLLSLSVGDQVSAQDCERAIPGNTQSPCKRLDYLAGIQPPMFIVEQFTDAWGGYACQSFLEFSSSSPLEDHSSLAVGGSGRGSEGNASLRWHLSSALTSNTWTDHISYIVAGYYPWGDSEPAFLAEENIVRVKLGRPLSLEDPVAAESPLVYSYLVVAVRFGRGEEAGNYVVVSDTYERPKEIENHQLLMNQCLGGITIQLEHDAAVETARGLAEEDRVRAETAAEEAENQAELAAIELNSAEDALIAAEKLNVALLQETILSIKREDVIRAAWQQVILVRMAGLEARTAIWNKAVTRWAEEDLQFSSAMEARIQEVERLQALNAALEQSMADQRRILIARLEELEKAEQEALATREPTN